MRANSLGRLLHGDYIGAATRYVALATLEFLALLGLLWVEPGLRAVDPEFEAAVVGLMVVPPTVLAYRSVGLLPCLALAVAPPLAVSLETPLFADVDPAYLVDPLSVYVGSALVVGVPAGVVAYLLGTGLAALRSRLDRVRCS